MPRFTFTLGLLLFSSSYTLATAAAPLPHLRALASPLYINTTQQQQQQHPATTTTDNGSYTPPKTGPLPSQGFTKPRPAATTMVHLTQVNSSSWVSPENETWYTTEYWAANTAAQDICDVKLSIPLPSGVNMDRVRMNSSYALAFEGDNNNGEASSSSMVQSAVKAALTFFFDTGAHVMTATLHPPYTQQLRVRESVDLGFTLRGPDAALAQTGMARVVSARYCDGGVEEEAPKDHNNNNGGESSGNNNNNQAEKFGPNAGGNGGSSSGASRPSYAAGGH